MNSRPAWALSVFQMIHCCLLLLALLAACSHESKRDNPFDPTLTVAPQLEVALDDRTGTATLTWTAYEGEAPFAAYWVLRNELKSTDEAPLADVAYQYRIVVRAR